MSRFLQTGVRFAVAEMEWREHVVGAFGRHVGAVVIQEADRLSYTTTLSREDARRVAEETMQAEVSRRLRGDR